jgi:Fur family transcriptional regulator, ferric uptake regulator
MQAIQKQIQRFHDFLDVQGLKLTNERMALLREIFEIHYHFDADELLFKMKQKNVKISRATIYRTLDLLVRSGLVRRLDLGEDHFHYERVTRDVHHDHLICTGCGTVIEFQDDAILEREIAICQKKRFLPAVFNLQILGVCESCQKRGEQPVAPDRVKMVQAAANALRK